MTPTGSPKSPIRVQTLDSLATEVLADSDDGEVRGSFDQRVAAATEQLREQGWDRIEQLEHLIVDEIQDVVGVRADFLLALLHAAPESCGFTLLGDPAQGIYDFQLRDPAHGPRVLSKTRAADLLDALRRDERVVTRELTGQYRARTREARAAAELRAAALERAGAHVIELFYSRLAVVGLNDLSALARGWGGRTAFLTATNGQAMLVAEQLAAGGNPVSVRRSAQLRVLSGWIAAVLGGHPTHDISRDEFEGALTRHLDVGSSADYWRGLRQVSGGRGASIALQRLAWRLPAQRNLPPILLDQPATPLVVSTVHRAKGLEFDNVALVDFKPRSRDDIADDEAELMRERFVALTRAQSRLFRVTGPDDRDVRAFKNRDMADRRWIRVGFKAGYTFGFECRPTDVRPLEEEGAPAAQEKLRATVPGARVDFAINRDESTMLRPVYDIRIDDRAVARTSEAFGRDLAARLGGIGRRWPSLGPTYLESVVTMCGQPGPASRHGLYLAPAIAGLLRLEWKD